MYNVIRGMSRVFRGPTKVKHNASHSREEGEILTPKPRRRDGVHTQIHMPKPCSADSTCVPELPLEPRVDKPKNIVTSILTRGKRWERKRGARTDQLLEEVT